MKKQVNTFNPAELTEIRLYLQSLSTSTVRPGTYYWQREDLLPWIASPTFEYSGCDLEGPYCASELHRSIKIPCPPTGNWNIVGRWHAVGRLAQRPVRWVRGDPLHIRDGLLGLGSKVNWSHFSKPSAIHISMRTLLQREVQMRMFAFLLRNFFSCLECVTEHLFEKVKKKKKNNVTSKRNRKKSLYSIDRCQQVGMHRGCTCW